MPLKPPASAVAMLCLGAAVFLLCPPAARSQDKSKYDPNRPAELLAVYPEIRALFVPRRPPFHPARFPGCFFSSALRPIAFTDLRRIAAILQRTLKPQAKMPTLGAKVWSQTH